MTGSSTSPIGWPAKARQALALLFRPLQDIDIYVEDRNDTVFYTELFRRIVGDRVRIARVLPQGDRLSVLRRAAEHDFSDRRALFVIDGDFEWVRGEAPPLGREIFRLDAYCIENLLILEEPALRIFVEEAVVSDEEATAALKFQKWLQGISATLVDLFISFAVLNQVNPDEPTVGLGVNRVITARKKGSNPILDPVKVEALRREVDAKSIANVGLEEVERLTNAIRLRVNSSSRPTDVISGKDFLLPLFEYHLWTCANCKTKRPALRFRLARNCSLERFKDLANSVVSAAS